MDHQLLQCRHFTVPSKTNKSETKVPPVTAGGVVIEECVVGPHVGVEVGVVDERNCRARGGGRISCACGGGEIIGGGEGGQGVALGTGSGE